MLKGGVAVMASQTMQGYELALPTTSPSPSTTLAHLKQPQPHRSAAHLIVKMANRGYDVVVDVDQEVRSFPTASHPFVTDHTAGRLRPH